MNVRLSVHVCMHVCRYTYVHNVCVYTHMVHVQKCHRLTVSRAEGSESYPTDPQPSISKETLNPKSYVALCNPKMPKP